MKIRCDLTKKLTAAEIKSLQDANVPVGYEFQEAFDPTRRIIAKYILGMFLAFLVLFLILHLNEFIRPDFNANQYVKSYLSFGLGYKLLIMLAIFVLAVATAVVHEACHGLAYFIFTRKKPQFGCRGGNPFAALALRSYLKKYEAALSAVAPLAIISLVLVPWKIACIEILPFIFIVFIINVGLSTADIGNVFYFLSMPDDVLIGFDGYSGAVYKLANQRNSDPDK